uniref:Uncharacterized protein n=1 Tax=Angiostrongylus cantonensis TaxID=6313 RepID=A0A0K0DFJ0_ANGCA
MGSVVYGTGVELVLGTCDSRVGGFYDPVNTCLSMNIDLVEQLTSRIGRLRSNKCELTPAMTTFVVYVPTLSYDEDEVETFHVDAKVLQTGRHILQRHHCGF